MRRQLGPVMANKQLVKIMTGTLSGDGAKEKWCGCVSEGTGGGGEGGGGSGLGCGAPA